MDKNKRVWSLDAIIVMLAGACVLLATALVLANPIYIPFVLLVIALLAGAIAYNIGRLRKWLHAIIGSGGQAANMQQTALASLQLPMVACSQGLIIWHNKQFKEMLGLAEELPLLHLQKLLPGLNTAESTAAKGCNIMLNNEEYTVFGGMAKSKTPLYFAVFINDTELKLHTQKYHLSRPAVIYFVIDTYENLLKDVRESERNRIIAEVDKVLDDYISSEKGFIRKLDSWNYVAIVEEKAMRKFVANRFNILDAVAKAGGIGCQIGVSAGVGRFGEDLLASEQMAAQALDMALGRGGNQVALKQPNGYTFFGGVSQGAEKKSKVRSRVMANAIAKEIEKADRVLIMGHKNADMDSLGACIGMWRFSKFCKKNATIVFNHKKTMAEAMYNYLCGEGYSEEFILPEHAAPLVKGNTLLIVADTHLPYLLESPALLEKCKTVVVIDHHRKMVNHIDNAEIFHHDTTASSASEMVAEMLGQLAFIGEVNLKTAEAIALLTGILLDTRVFSLHVGVHTFEAAAYLKAAGAETELAKSFFSTSIENYVLRSRLVAHAGVYNGFAVSVGQEDYGQEVDVIAAQSANDLLTISGVKASIVAVKKDDYIQVSSRSMGQVNVQLIMEKLGGGGHLTMAAAQLRDTDIKDVPFLIEAAIDEYVKEHMLKS